MNQKSIVTWTLVSVIVIMGGFIAHDVKNKMKARIDDKPAENWQWKNDWNDSSTKEEKKEDPVVPEIPVVEQVIANDYSDALAKSKETMKPILILASADWCDYCKQMEKETLQNEEVKASIKNYILLKINTDKDKVTARKLKISGLPAYVVINSKEEVLKKGNGMMDSKTFLEFLNNPKFSLDPKNNDKAEPVPPQKRRERRRL